uniref:Pectinacetylesterase n=1 Tax=uncultured bacterium fosmid pJB39A3 TaxID=1478063 RepID=A0A0H3U7J2_9BACT|nr:hypothetical protein [uncultured bacterium fosmid pJB39A3]
MSERWITIQPEGSISSDGSEWSGKIHKGSENKLAVIFYGGGVAYNDASAQATEGFFIRNMKGLEAFGKDGIFSDSKDNPFADWNIITIPYTTGDFHVGTGDYTFTEEDGTVVTRYHHGYTNYRLMMDAALKELNINPDALLVTGFSAGGFGTSFLTGDIIENYFPDVKNVTALVDSSLLFYTGWKTVAKEIWKAPDKIVERIASGNVTIDNLRALRADHPEVKILFDCSNADEVLSAFTKIMVTDTDMMLTAKGRNRFKLLLSEMIADLLELPNSGVFIWNLPGSMSNMASTYSKHTIEAGDEFFTESFAGHTIAGWAMDAVEGKVYSCGLDLLF